MEMNCQSEINSAYFKRAAREQLVNNWGNAALFTLLYVIVTAVISSLNNLIPLLGVVLVSPMVYSFYVAFLQNKRYGDELSVESLFDGYKDFQRIVFTSFLMYLYTFLWMLLLIVPGIIKAISYSQTLYVLKDNPELTTNAAIERSMAMMEGYKMKYFILQLSFIGWILLVILTCGILSLWITPYMSAANANFYEYVKEEYNKKNTL